MPTFKSHEEVRDKFRDNGMSVAHWARSHGFTLPLVYAVLHGRSRALRGESYKIAVALGLRPPPNPDAFVDLPSSSVSDAPAEESAM